jgi:uncharacterized protein
MVRPNIQIPQERLAIFCRKYHIRRLALFGSILREDFRPESDVDVLVEFDTAPHVGFAGWLTMEEELAQLLGGEHRVEIVKRERLNRWIRDRVLREAKVQYVA